MPFDAPIEDRYNDLLRQRIALEGELSLLRKSKEAEVGKARTRGNRFLLLLLLLPLVILLFPKPKTPSVSERVLLAERDSLQRELNFLETTRKDSIRYIVKKGDMLISLGELFFNDPTAGYQIGKDNGYISKHDQYHLPPNDTLVIKFR